GGKFEHRIAVLRERRAGEPAEIVALDERPTGTDLESAVPHLRVVGEAAAEAAGRDRRDIEQHVHGLAIVRGHLERAPSTAKAHVDTALQLLDALGRDVGIARNATDERSGLAGHG